MIGRMSRRGPDAGPPSPRSRRRLLVGGVVFWVVVLLVAFVAWQWLARMETLRRSEVYAEAVARAGSHPQVLAALGQPVEAGWWVRGEVEREGPAERARVAVPLAGPDGRGRLAAEARRHEHVWRFDRLEVTLPDGTVVDLLAAPPPPEDTGALAAAIADAAATATAMFRPSPPWPAPPLSSPPWFPAPPRPAPPTRWHDVGIERRS
jgi:hypothetical protein